jgi:serine protease
VTQNSPASVQAATPSSDNSETITLDRPLNEQQLRQLAEALERNPAVEFAVPEKIERAQQANDPQFGAQWHYHQDRVGIRLAPAWERATGTNVVVAVLDTGIRPHEDLAGQVLPGYDFVSGTTRSNDGDGRDADPTDPGDWCNLNAVPVSSWHGLHVAGTIAAVTNNAVGGAGVARDARVLPVRVLGQCGGSSLDITDGIRWAAGVPVPGVPANPRPARVINLSLGGAGACDADYADAIRSARQRGVTVVVAAGNSDTDVSNSRPANCEGVISVAATNREGGRSYFGRANAGSNFGSGVKIAAPGGETFATAANGILSTMNDGVRGPGKDSYESYQGTSMAAPHVAGVVALMYQAHPAITPDEVLTILRATSQPFPAVANRPCSPATCGAGIVDAQAAVIEAARRAAAPQATSIALPTNTGDGRATAPTGAVPANQRR